MQQLRKSSGANWTPGEKWFRDLVAKAILFREAQRIVRSLKFKASQSNITAYLVSLLADRYGERFDLDRVWRTQAISPQLSDLMRQWAPKVDEALRLTAAGRQVSEWAKKEGCWLQVRQVELDPAEGIPEIR